MKRPVRGLALAALALAASAGALAQASACPESVQDLPPEALYGRWEARFDGLPAVAVVQLGRHPEYAAHQTAGLQQEVLPSLMYDLGELV